MFLRRILFRSTPSDFLAKKYPVSVKGIIVVEGRVALLKNERNEWELPGGKLEKGEKVEITLVREIKEELAIDVEVSTLIDVWIYNILNKVEVLIITYLCKAQNLRSSDLKLSNEHKELALFKPEEINGLNMPAGYKDSIAKALKHIV